MIAIPVWNIHSAHKNDPDASAAVFKAFSAEKLPPSPRFGCVHGQILSKAADINNISSFYLWRAVTFSG